MLANRLGRRDLAAEEALRLKGFADEQKWITRFFEIAGRYEDKIVQHNFQNIRLVPDMNPNDEVLPGEQVGARVIDAWRR